MSGYASVGMNNANAGCPVLAVPFGKDGKNKSCAGQSSIPPFANDAKDGAPDSSFHP
jgi:hypothetical protein